MKEYSEVLKNIILESRHTFIYGENNARSAYLKELSKNVYQEDGKKTIPIYVDFEGFEYKENKDCDIHALNLFQSTYFELYMTLKIFELLKKELSEQELGQVEKHLPELFFDASINNFENLEHELKVGMAFYKEAYDFYLKNGEVKADLFDDVKIHFVTFDMFLPELKHFATSIQEFLFIVDKTKHFSNIYTQLINTYVASRSQSYLSMKIGCENNLDWNNYYTINDIFIEYVHDYGIVNMDDFKLSRTKKGAVEDVK